MTDTSKQVILNYQNFDKIVSNNFILVDFWAKWCVPCKILDPILEEVAEELKGKVLIGKVNVDDNRVLSAKFGVANIPTMLLFKNGEKVHQFYGVQPKEIFLNTINKKLKIK